MASNSRVTLHARFVFSFPRNRADDGIRARRSAVYGPVPHVDACLLPHQRRTTRREGHHTHTRIYILGVECRDRILLVYREGFSLRKISHFEDLVVVPAFTLPETTEIIGGISALLIFSSSLLYFTPSLRYATFSGEIRSDDYSTSPFLRNL